MANYLLEIGTEELPADHVGEALERLETLLGDALRQANLSFQGIKTYGTPRRLAVIVTGLPDKQETIHKKVKGPPVKSSLDASGKPLPPAQGFAAKQGLKFEDLQQEEVGGVTYLMANVTIAGQSSSNVIAEIIPTIIGQLSGERLMRWADLEFKFSRPIRWIVSLMDKNVVPFSLANLTAGRNSFGHRILAPGTIEITSPETYIEQLKTKKVLVDKEDRQKVVAEQVVARCKELKGQPRQLKGSLLSEVTNITEWPSAVIGSFAVEYLDLPDTLIETIMVHHQRYFPVEDTSGKLLPNFISIANNDLKEAEPQIRAGNERVLRARLADGRFFYFDDQKVKLSDHKNDLGQLTFHEGLGSYSDKQQRLVDAAKLLGGEISLNAEQKICLERTMELCKLDLVTSLVRELPELQGFVGSWYALKQSEPPQVAAAIASHYAPRSTDDSIPADVVGRLAAVLDKLDNLTGVFLLGKRATGSSDPYILRRQAQGLIDILVEEKQYRINTSKLMDWLSTQFYPYIETAKRQKRSKKNNDLIEVNAGDQILDTQIKKDVSDLREFLLVRLKTKLTDKGFKREAIEAVLASGDPLSDVTDVIERLSCLEEVMGENGGIAVVRAGVRVGNIISADSPETVNEGLFGEESEKALWQSFNKEVVSVWGNGATLKKPANKDEYRQLMNLLSKIAQPIDRLFDEVLVNDPDKAKRDNRHALLKNVDRYFKTVADFPKLQPLL
ncbi:MAG: glycine--tRNA ligase subunit beta [Candidatus Obscuribacterales bacterium]|nr:glycine--tRNA ligase subunit beta [Candidatus Obscuribacterales bacterium]